MSSQITMNRRALLGSALALAAGSTLLEPRAWASPRNIALAPLDFKQQLRGPVVSIPTPFTADFQVDHASTRNLIHQAQAHGMRIFDLTSGDGQYAYLSYEEVKALLATVVKAVDGKGLVIAGTGAWWTGRAVDFAKYAESLGATAVQVILPRGAPEDGSVEHFRKIARATRLPIVLHGKYSDSLLRKLSPIDSIVAMKEDVDLHYLIQTLIHFGKRYNCFTGGSYEWFVTGQPYGCKAYFDAFSTFYPKISQQFWGAVQKGDVPTEKNIIEKYENSFIWTKFSHSFWHATLEYFGVAKRYLRPPVESYTDEQMKEIKAYYDKLGIYPQHT